jgi:hypothetical protein
VKYVWKDNVNPNRSYVAIDASTYVQVYKLRCMIGKQVFMDSSSSRKRISPEGEMSTGTWNTPMHADVVPKETEPNAISFAKHGYQ